MMPTPVLRIVTPAGPYGAVLPEWTDLSVGGDTGENMVLDLTYNTAAATYPLLADGVTVAVLLNGTELTDGRFVLDGSADDEVLDVDTGTWQGNSLLFRLSYAIVYPESGPVTGTNVTTPGWGFAAQTPGQALRELLEAAQARGWWTGLTWDFTDGVDSSGAAWTANVNEFYDMGTTLLDIVVRWKTRKIAVAKMAGTVLKLYRYNTQGTDRSATQILLRGVDLTEGPVNRSSRNAVSVILGTTDGLGDTGGFGIARTDAPALSQWGRREGYVSQSQIPDSTTLSSIVDGTLALKARQREAFTYGLTCTRDGLLPFINFDRGDTVTIRARGATRVMQVRQLSVTWDKDGLPSGSAAFGDRKMDTEEQLAQRLEQLTSGSMDGGAFGAPVLGAPDQGGEPTPPALEPNTMPPGPPTGLSVSTAVVFEQGYLSATGTVSWTAPTVNADASAILDLGGFDVQYRHTGDPNWINGGRFAKDVTTAVILRLVVGSGYDYRVRAVDTWDNVSSWATGTFTATNDVIAPSQTPSTPTVATFLFSGLLITWNGLAASGAMDNDTRHVEVHLSTASGFTPGSGTYKDKIEVGGGQVVVGELTPGTTYYVKLRSVDWAGNIGPSSAQATGVPDSVQTGDIATGAVTATKIGALAVGTAAIDALAVTDAKIATLSVTKITTGTLTAVVTNSGTIQTAASGARTLIDSAGVKLYDSAGNITVRLNSADGTATFTGVIGAATITGYVKVFSGTSAVLVQNVGSVPTITLTTGRLIEKYPAYVYTANDSFMRTLWTQINAPGSQYAGGGTNYDYSSYAITTMVYDGDFANATTLPTKITGWHTLAMPLSAAGTAYPRVVISTNYTSLTGGNDFHRYTAVALKDGTAAQHEAAIRLDPTGSTQEECIITVCKIYGGVEGAAYAGVAASAFTVSSGRASKTDVGDIPYSAVEVIRANPAKRWRYQTEDKFALGPMADDLPAEVVTVLDEDHGMPGVVEHHVSLLAMIGLLWRAIEELDARLETRT
jgi:hypothetical protein